MNSTHTVKSFDKDLDKLVATIAEMGGLAEANLAAAIDAVSRRDSALALKTIEADARIDRLEQEIDEAVVRLIALRQPVAADLRLVIAALRIASDIERIGDYAANVAKRAIALNQQPLVRPVHMIPRIGEVVQEMIKDTLDAYVQRDPVKARAVWERDGEVDEMYNSLFRELLTYMMEDPRSIHGQEHRARRRSRHQHRRTGAFHRAWRGPWRAAPEGRQDRLPGARRAGGQVRTA